ncbi:nitroreductase family protein [Tissierella sp.]|uniref:nitroreductase family protein n=1 Tax=Tissierella sp. TaxID=41274 RepID=UPI00285F462C|nr:nitroreductase family protein [Tissierella sp.]MDR7855783.1 nitroreductase family protein [Tissierella sp.]
MTKNFYEGLKERRSYYGISKENVISDEKLQELIEDVVKHTPSAFNSQTARVVLLLGKNHTKLWDITTEIMRQKLSPEQFPTTEGKLKTFEAGYGTVLFFEDTSIVKSLQEQFPSYKDNFPIWSLESSGMNQYNVWLALELEGYGASLQHYNELIEEDVKKEWNIPDSWQLRSQMPFGKAVSEPGEKDFSPIEERVKVYK